MSSPCAVFCGLFLFVWFRVSRLSVPWLERVRWLHLSRWPRRVWLQDDGGHCVDKRRLKTAGPHCHRTIWRITELILLTFISVLLPVMPSLSLSVLLCLLLSHFRIGTSLRQKACVNSCLISTVNTDLLRFRRPYIGNVYRSWVFSEI